MPILFITPDGISVPSSIEIHCGRSSKTIGAAGAGIREIAEDQGEVVLRGLTAFRSSISNPWKPFPRTLGHRIYRNVETRETWKSEKRGN